MKTKTVVICELCNGDIHNPEDGFAFKGGVSTAVAGRARKELMPEGAVHRQCFANKFQLKAHHIPERTER